jgi:hypothetical protein
MNKTEALTILRQELDGWRRRSYDELVSSIGKQTCLEVLAPSGTGYQLEIETVWDGKHGGNVRVLGAVVDCSMRALMPLTEDFIVAPDGNFTGE